MPSPLLELLAPSVCPGCDGPRREGEPLLCGACRAGVRPLRRLDRVHTALAYEGTAARLVQRFKFERRLDALEVLLEPLVARVAGLRADGVVPVPRHPHRVRELRSDPAFDLARALARRARLPLWSRALHRTRPTPPQTDLPPRERRANVRGSFGSAAGSLAGRRVLLVDDVATTGATLAEASRVLRARSRARAVVRVALAGTPRG